MKKMLLSAMSLFLSMIAVEAQEPVLEEGFEEDGVPPTGWTVRSCSDAASNKYKWEQVAYGSDPLKYRSGYVQGGQKAMMVSSGKTTSTKPAPDSWLISPQLAVGSDDKLSFMLAYAPVYNDNAVVPADKRIKFAVVVSTTGTDAADFTETLMEFAPYGETDWRKYTLDLDKFAGKNIYIAFREYGDCTLGAITLNRTWIDDVYVGKTSSSDMVPTQLLSPVAGPKLMQNVSFQFTNNALPSSQLTASYSIDGGAPVSETLDASVVCAAGDTLSYTFATPATLTPGATNSVKVWISADNDIVDENDTLVAGVAIDNIFTLPYEMNSDNLSQGWTYTYHTGKLNRGTNTGWWQVPDETYTKYVWSYKLCAKESVLEGKWLKLDKGKINLDFNYTSGTDVPLTLVLTDSETGETTETECSLPAATEAADAKVSVKVASDGLYKLGIKCGTEYVGPFTVNSLAVSKVMPVDVAMASVDIPSAVVADSVYSVRVKVNNYGEAAVKDVPVSISVDGEVVLTDVIPSVESGKTVDYTLTGNSAVADVKGLRLAAGLHSVNAYTSLEDDPNMANDTVAVNVYAYTKPEIPFADSFESSDDNMRWTAENYSDNVLNWTLGSAISNNVNWAKGSGENVAYMSSVSGAEHNASLVSPVIRVTEPGKVRLSYYYTTRMTSAQADAETYLTATVRGVASDFSVSRTDTVTDANVGVYRQGYLLADITRPGDYQLVFSNTGMGHDLILDDIRFDRFLDLAVVDASQTAASGFNNTVNSIAVKVANHGAADKSGFGIRLTATTTSGSASMETMARYEETVNAGDTVTYVFDNLDVSAPDTYSYKVEIVADDDTDDFNNSWTLPLLYSYANAVLPYVADFDSGEQQSQWTLTGAWQTGKYSSSNSAYNGYGAISHHKKAVSEDGDWAFSGCIEIPAGTYSLSFFYRTFLNGKTPNLYAQNFALYLGAEPEAGAMTRNLYTSPADELAYEKRYKRVDEKITVAEAGKYYLGIKCSSASPYGVLYIDDIRISADDDAPTRLTSYDADFADWYRYDPSDQFSQWETAADGTVSTSQSVYNAGNPHTELPGFLVSPAFDIEKDATVSAKLTYSIGIDNPGALSEEEKNRIAVILYEGGDDARESFTQPLAIGSDISGAQHTAEGTFMCNQEGVHYFAVGLTGAGNSTADEATVTYNIYGLNISAEVSGISSVTTVESPVELFTADGRSLGRFSTASQAMKGCSRKGMYIMKSQSSPAVMKVAR